MRTESNRDSSPASHHKPHDVSKELNLASRLTKCLYHEICKSEPCGLLRTSHSTIQPQTSSGTCRGSNRTTISAQRYESLGSESGSGIGKAGCRLGLILRK